MKPIKFTFSEGVCLPKDQFNKIVSASITLGKCIYKNPPNGYTDKNGVDHIPVGLVCTPNEIEYAINVFQSFIKAWKGDE